MNSTKQLEHGILYRFDILRKIPTNLRLMVGEMSSSSVLSKERVRHTDKLNIVHCNTFSCLKVYEVYLQILPQERSIVTQLRPSKYFCFMEVNLNISIDAFFFVDIYNVFERNTSMRCPTASLTPLTKFY